MTTVLHSHECVNSGKNPALDIPVHVDLVQEVVCCNPGAAPHSFRNALNVSLAAAKISEVLGRVSRNALSVGGVFREIAACAPDVGSPALPAVLDGMRQLHARIGQCSEILTPYVCPFEALRMLWRNLKNN